MNLERLEKLIGLPNLVKVKNLSILIIGIGGVGGYTLESLVRSGVNNITIVDGDTIDETNLNRQIITNINNIGESKVEIANKHARNINPNIILSYYNEYLNKNNIKKINVSKFDYVVDACDDIDAKVLIINECLKNNTKIIKPI